MSLNLLIQRTTDSWTDITDQLAPISHEERYRRDGRAMMAYHAEPHKLRWHLLKPGETLEFDNKRDFQQVPDFFCLNQPGAFIHWWKHLKLHHFDDPATQALLIWLRVPLSTPEIRLIQENCGRVLFHSQTGRYLGPPDRFASAAYAALCHEPHPRSELWELFRKAADLLQQPVILEQTSSLKSDPQGSHHNLGDPQFTSDLVQHYPYTQLSGLLLTRNSRANTLEQLQLRYRNGNHRVRNHIEKACIVAYQQCEDPFPPCAWDLEVARAIVTRWHPKKNNKTTPDSLLKHPKMLPWLFRREIILELEQAILAHPQCEELLYNSNTKFFRQPYPTVETIQRAAAFDRLRRLNDDSPFRPHSLLTQELNQPRERIPTGINVDPAEIGAAAAHALNTELQMPSEKTANARLWWTEALRKSIPSTGSNPYHPAFVRTAITLPGIAPEIWAPIAALSI